MSRLDDAFDRLGKALVPGASTWTAGTLKSLNESAERRLAPCEIPDCVVCQIEAST